MSETLPATAHAGLAQADVPAFRVDGADYRWGHVFEHAHRCGDWRILETEVRQALACRRLAAEAGPPLDREAERAAAVAFRRARRLHAAEDLEAWLAARDLTVAQWRHYVRGEALRRRHAAELDTVVERYRVDAAAVQEELGGWGWCSEQIPRWAGQLASRAAAAHATCERTGDPQPDPHDLERLEELYDRFAADVATVDRLEALLAARYLDWLRLELDMAVFDSPDTAAEARLCIRDDGWSLPEAARAGRARLQRHHLLVEGFDAGIRHVFIRAQEGDLLGPLPVAGQPTLVRVRHKAAPSLDDEELRLAATREIVGTAAAREVDDRVEWLHPR